MLKTVAMVNREIHLTYSRVFAEKIFEVLICEEFLII